jgi:predicted MPP superfamily phosphohydrolase
VSTTVNGSGPGRQPPAEDGAPRDPRRRRFLRRALFGGAALAVGAAGAKVVERLERRELDVALSGPPSAFRGLRIGLVSDMHRSPVVSKERCRLAAALLEGASCDLIVNLGDNVSWSAKYASSALSGLRQLNPPEGKFAVLGNHEYWTDAKRGQRALEDAGFRVLTNSHALLQRGAEELHLVGIDDLWSGRPDYEAAFREVPEDACAVVLSHNPDAIYDRRVRRAGLVLAGHTHGGQIVGVSRVTQPLAHCRYGAARPHGLYREGRAQIYVTSGAGTGGVFCLRVGVPPEVAVIALRPAGTAASHR